MLWCGSWIKDRKKIRWNDDESVNGKGMGITNFACVESLIYPFNIIDNMYCRVRKLYSRTNSRLCSHTHKYHEMITPSASFPPEWENATVFWETLAKQSRWQVVLSHVFVDEKRDKVKYLLLTVFKILVAITFTTSWVVIPWILDAKKVFNFHKCFAPSLNIYERYVCSCWLFTCERWCFFSNNNACLLR